MSYSIDDRFWSLNNNLKKIMETNESVHMSYKLIEINCLFQDLFYSSSLRHKISTISSWITLKLGSLCMLGSRRQHSLPTPRNGSD